MTSRSPDQLRILGLVFGIAFGGIATSTFRERMPLRLRCHAVMDPGAAVGITTSYSTASQLSSGV
ncbi:hypothetical protein BO86DRAFT_386706 [Aspergillus japonicus CBS 114.51]|uniref:Uncharacterized protein n=1 Tax=Aspergillus japonicus CBS 114.51 TaxID=1448312 RepID=A0A8T8X8V4_ASPJA|nr:hypothetical protein BO86DRAFT_386706 [Aspergillus japonicus CBS 114.51]RAH84556.1 hypothetical protein BO86DRAFT_386706 [Aspergillus japonicus CBS 114.51]